MIEVEGLTKRFGSTLAVDDLSFSVRPGSVTGFLGPNGAGKSTTMRAILGLVLPTAGRTAVLGRPYRDLDRPLKRVGSLLETFDAHPGRSGRNHLRVLAVSGGLPRSRVEEVLALVDLSDAGRRRVKGYSLGMRQRLGLAAALLGDPEVLVLDEPANGLDPQGIRWLRDFLRSLASEGRTILISSHVLAEVAQTVDEVVIIHRGKLVRQAAMAEVEAMAAGSTLVRSPEAERLAALLAEGELVSRALGDGRLAVAAPPERVGEIAAANAVVLHELTSERATLEEVFLELTGDPGGARRVTHRFAAELVKLRTLRSTWGIMLVAFALAGLFTAGTIGGESDLGRLEPDFQFRLVLDGAFPAVILALLLGMIHFTNEFRHGTIARTLLATPRRDRLVAVKLLAGASIGLGLVAITFASTAAVGAIWLGAVHVPLELGEVAEAGVRAAAGAVVAGSMGAVLGGALHSQVGALVGTLVWIFIAEPIVWVLLGLIELDGVSEYLPAAALLAVADSSGEGLSFGPAAAVALAWIALATSLALLRTRRADIT